MEIKVLIDNERKNRNLVVKVLKNSGKARFNVLFQIKAIINVPYGYYFSNIFELVRKRLGIQKGETDMNFKI